MGIGCDGASHIALDMFTQIRALKAGVTAQWGLPVFDPMVVPNDQLLRMITFEVPGNPPWRYAWRD